MRAGGSGAKNRHGEAGAGRGAGRDAEIRQSPEWQADTAQAERIDNTYRTREYKVYGMTHMHGIHRHR